MHEVRHILHDREMFWVEEQQTVCEVAHKMSTLSVGAILVLSGGELRGIFSERDLMKRIVVAGLDPGRTPVGQVMTTDVATIDENTTLEQAMSLMHEYKCRHLPVMRSGKAAGMVSMRDLMDIELERIKEEITHMRAYIHGAA